MDKLKPVIAQIFWILFFIALLLPVIGWFMGTGTMASTIDQRIGVINGLNPQAGATVPNDQWISKVTEVEKVRQERLATASDYLWDQQQQYMTWPTSLGSKNIEEIQSKTFEDDLSREALNAYRYRFDQLVESLRQSVEPYEWKEKTQKMDGKVLLDYGVLPLPFAEQAWFKTMPSSKEVWYLQEDIWLLRGLLLAVKDVNDRAGADANIMKVPIKQIVSIQLSGGNREALTAMASGEAMSEDGAAGGHSSGMGGMAAPMSMGGAGGFGGMSGEEGMGGGVTGGALDFDIAEEVGPAAAAGMAADGSGGEMESSMAEAASGMGGMPGMPGAPGANPIVAEKRYVDDVGLPYKTRAFKMQVIMDHRQIPEFLVELTGSPFPVQILRVHFAELNPDPTFASGATGGMGGGAYDPEGGGGFSGRGGGSFMGGASRGGAFGGRGGSMPMPMGGAVGRGGSFGAGRGGIGLGGSSRAGSMPFGGSRGGAFGGRGGSMPMPMGGSAGRGGSFGAGRGGIGLGGARPGLPFRGGLSSGMEEGGEYGMGPGGGTGVTDLAAQALADPYLAHVVIAGLMTIYRSEEEIANAAEGEAATEEPVDNAAAAGEAPPADAAAPEGEVPADGALPPEGTAPDGAAPEAGVAPPAGEAPADGTPPAGEVAPVDGAAPADGAPAPDAAAPVSETPADAAPAEPPPAGEDAPAAVPQ